MFKHEPDTAEPDLSIQPGFRLARGVCRFLIDAGGAPITEYVPARGLRMDVAALTDGGEIWCIECKSSVADFQSDAKWHRYLDWCDRYFFAVDEVFPTDILPDDHGLIIADDFGAEIIRPAPLSKLSAARRGAQTRKLARAAMLRLRGHLDPGVAALVTAEG